MLPYICRQRWPVWRTCPSSRPPRCRAPATATTPTPRPTVQGGRACVHGSGEPDACLLVPFEAAPPTCATLRMYESTVKIRSLNFAQAHTGGRTRAACRQGWRRCRSPSSFGCARRRAPGNRCGTIPPMSSSSSRSPPWAPLRCAPQQVQLIPALETVTLLNCFAAPQTEH